ncbi:hypothetical protein L3Q82_026111 [Scortum barcoo]|uniref:Uncharacterized protein n=1 Tax=Scortum barcoo TaxID=214431 RepID=A0ACB8WMV4_9TELE|nr:hypothetical protein L3Q82_026111 [Scortum barcoo]
MPPGRLPREVFQACPTGRRPRERPRTRWRDYVSRLAWERLGVPPEELEEVSGSVGVSRYGDLRGELLCVELEKERQGLGLSLAGNRDRSRVSIFVVGLHPGGAAARDGRIRVGDELLEINNQILYGRSHQNASAIIKSAAAKVKLILLRGKYSIFTPPVFFLRAVIEMKP